MVMPLLSDPLKTILRRVDYDALTAAKDACIPPTVVELPCEAVLIRSCTESVWSPLKVWK